MLLTVNINYLNNVIKYVVTKRYNFNDETLNNKE